MSGTDVAAAALSVAFALALYRLMSTRTDVDRAIAVNVGSYGVAGLVAVLSASTGAEHLLNAVLIVVGAVLVAVAVIAVASMRRVS